MIKHGIMRLWIASYHTKWDELRVYDSLKRGVSRAAILDHPSDQATKGEGRLLQGTRALGC
jgi:hypothetical protein